MLAIFDLDGTLVDSVEQIASSVNQACMEFGLPQATLDHYLATLGQPIGSILSYLNLEVELREKLVDRFRQILLSEICANNSIFPGVVESLAFLVDSGVNLAIATTKPTYLAQAVVDNSALKDFPILVVGTDGVPPKPDPFILNICLKHFGLKNAVMIGDREEDIRAAIGAGISSVGIAASGHTSYQLENAGAGAVFDSFQIFSDHLFSGGLEQFMWAGNTPGR